MSHMQIDEGIDHVLRTRQHVMVTCPAHDDRTASLHVGPGEQHPVVMSCQAGCHTADIVRIAGIDLSRIMTPRDRGTSDTTYIYVDEKNAELFRVIRRPLGEDGTKKFSQCHMQDGTLVWNIKGVRRVLYRLPQVMEAIAADEEVWLCEGEKDVLRAVNEGRCGTTMPGGAKADGKSWLPEYSEALKGSRVTIVADRDPIGRDHAQWVRAALLEVGCTVRIVESALTTKGSDLSDHFDARKGWDDLVVTTPYNTDRDGPSELDFHAIAAIQVTEEDYVIPGMLARNDRMVLTGFEGHGKSEFLRQVGTLVAAGRDPFTLAPIPPRRVLVIDAENPERQSCHSWASLKARVARNQFTLEPEMLTVLSCYKDELDLATARDMDYLMGRVYVRQPDLIIIGPCQNLVSRDLREDEVVRKLKRGINHLRTVCGSAILMEHHCPHKQQGDKERSTRPYGSGLFMKWPDIGLGLKPDEDGTFALEQWRGFRLREQGKGWPEQVRVGTPKSLEFPFMAHEDVSRSTNVVNLH